MKVTVVLDNEEWIDGYSFGELATTLRIVAQNLNFGRDHGDYLGTKWSIEDDADD